MAERLLDMMWQLTTSADSPPEVLQSNVIADVLLQYRNDEYIEQYLARCVEQIRGKQVRVGSGQERLTLLGHGEGCCRTW